MRKKTVIGIYQHPSSVVFKTAVGKRGLVQGNTVKAVQVAPRTTNNMIFAGIIGLVLGICFALLQEYLDDRINTPDDARKILEAPILSYVPMVESSDNRLLTRARGGGTLLESYRVMRANVQFASIDSPSQSIVVTSTSPAFTLSPMSTFTSLT